MRTAPNKNRALPAQSWPRFSRYELCEDRAALGALVAGGLGGVVAPAAGARVEWYDPWAEVKLPHVPIGQLSRWAHGVERRWNDGGETRLTKRERGELLEWCRAHGLLGVLLPRLEALRTWPEAGVQWTYERQGASWRARGLLGRTDMPRAVIDGRPHQLDSGQWRQHFGAVLHGRQQLREYAYGEPGAEAFWRVYGEPVAQIVHAVADLGRAFEALRRLAPDNVDFGSAQSYVNERASRVSPALLLDGYGALTAAWRGTCLLDHFAAMASLSWAGADVRPCARCGATFFATKPDNLYCTARCKRAANQAAYRTKGLR